MCVCAVGSGTSTFLALNLTRNQLFSSANGARSGVRRVTILLTDGMSSSMTNTANSARLLKVRIPKYYHSLKGKKTLILSLSKRLQQLLKKLALVMRVSFWFLPVE